MKLLFSSLVVFTLLSSSSLFAADPKCELACDKFLECTKEMNKGKTATAAEIKRMKDGCLNTCKKKAREVIACYETSQSSCENFGLCIQRSHSSSKK
ncbi:MAG: Cys-rich protein [Leptospiraceae bacterium]|nr:Cys-rich protein [Leptospiraceae bacterium]